MRTRDCSFCYLCGKRGVLLYRNLDDRLFGSPGKWSLKNVPTQVAGWFGLTPCQFQKISDWRTPTTIRMEKWEPGIGKAL